MTTSLQIGDRKCEGLGDWGSMAQTEGTVVGVGTLATRQPLRDGERALVIQVDKRPSVSSQNFPALHGEREGDLEKVPT